MIEEKEKTLLPPLDANELEEKYGTSTEICPYIPIEKSEEI